MFVSRCASVLFALRLFYYCRAAGSDGQPSQRCWHYDAGNFHAFIFIKYRRHIDRPAVSLWSCAYAAGAGARYRYSGLLTGCQV